MIEIEPNEWGNYDEEIANNSVKFQWTIRESFHFFIIIIIIHMEWNEASTFIYLA